MAYYNTCPICEANLDPGEKCDCTRENPKEAFPAEAVKIENRTKQMVFNMEGILYEKVAN